MLQIFKFLFHLFEKDNRRRNCSETKKGKEEKEKQIFVIEMNYAREK